MIANRAGRLFGGLNEYHISVWSKPRLILYTGLLILFVATFLLLSGKDNPNHMDSQPTVPSSSLVLTSPAFEEGGALPAQYSCKGQNVSPPLAIAGLPAGTKSLALIMHDPDAVSGDFVHWLMWDIVDSTENIAANSLPAGAVQGQNGGGQNKYMGPCPPAGTGTHHYIFELYALDKTLGLKPGSDRDQLKTAMAGHILGQYNLTGLFSAN